MVVIIVPAVMSVIPVVMPVPSPVVISPSGSDVYIYYNRRVPAVVKRIVTQVPVTPVVRIIPSVTVS